MFKKKIDFEEEVKILGRKSNVNLLKTEYKFSSQLKKLDLEIDDVVKSRFKDFDDRRKIIDEYSDREVDISMINSYREKLKRI